MNLQDLIRLIAEKMNVSQKEAREAYDAVVASVTEAIQKKEVDRLALPGFVTFTKTEQAAAEKRNPRTGEKLNVPAHTKLKVTVAGPLKKSVR